MSTSGSFVPNQPSIFTPPLSGDQLIWFKTNFRPHFEDWIFGPINRLVISQDALIGFIFMSCVIDYLAGFMCGGESHRKDYQGFIDKYFPAGKYNSKGLYESLRCGLVHMFSIKNKEYALTHNNPWAHLKASSDGQVMLNASSFRDDLHVAAQKYFDEVQNNSELLTKFMRRYGSFGFLDLGNIAIDG